MEDQQVHEPENHPPDYRQPIVERGFWQARVTCQILALWLAAQKHGKAEKLVNVEKYLISKDKGHLKFFCFLFPAFYDTLNEKISKENRIYFLIFNIVILIHCLFFMMNKRFKLSLDILKYLIKKYKQQFCLVLLNCFKFLSQVFFITYSLATQNTS